SRFIFAMKISRGTRAKIPRSTRENPRADVRTPHSWRVSRAFASLRRLRARVTRVLALPAWMDHAVGDRTHALPQRNCGRFTRPSLLAGADKEQPPSSGTRRA